MSVNGIGGPCIGKRYGAGRRLRNEEQNDESEHETVRRDDRERFKREKRELRLRQKGELAQIMDGLEWKDSQYEKEPKRQRRIVEKEWRHSTERLKLRMEDKVRMYEVDQDAYTKSQDADEEKLRELRSIN